jgi:hypothetical protein
VNAWPDCCRFRPHGLILQFSFGVLLGQLQDVPFPSKGSKLDQRLLLGVSHEG